MTTGKALLDVPLDGRLTVPASEEESLEPALYAICSTCHGPAAAGKATCFSCAVLSDQLGALPDVVPLFLFSLGSPVHSALVGYKAGTSRAGRTARSKALTEVLGSWLKHHTSCLLGDTKDALVVPVPSSSGGRVSWHGAHPLETVCDEAASRSIRLRARAVLVPGLRPPARLHASASGFTVDPTTDVSGRTVLVVDDMFVSGSRSLSAAAALTRAGARVAAVVPLGRLVRPDHNSATAAFWAARCRLAFDASLCGLCDRGPARRIERASAWSISSPCVSERLAA